MPFRTGVKVSAPLMSGGQPQLQATGGLSVLAEIQCLTRVPLNAVDRLRRRGLWSLYHTSPKERCDKGVCEQNAMNTLSDNDVRGFGQAAKGCEPPTLVLTIGLQLCVCLWGGGIEREVLGKVTIVKLPCKKAIVSTG
jgi:hypothetical protein